MHGSHSGVHPALFVFPAHSRMMHGERHNNMLTLYPRAGHNFVNAIPILHNYAAVLIVFSLSLFSLIWAHVCAALVLSRSLSHIADTCMHIREARLFLLYHFHVVRISWFYLSYKISMTLKQSHTHTAALGRRAHIYNKRAQPKAQLPFVSKGTLWCQKSFTRARTHSLNRERKVEWAPIKTHHAPSATRRAIFDSSDELHTGAI